MGPRIAIIGGGISGLSAAYELAQHHPEIPFTLYEASSRPGGIVETIHAQGFTIECGPDSWVAEKPWARELAEELGLADEVIFSNDYQRRTYLVQDGRLVPMPDGMRMMVPARWEPLVHSPLLSWQGKLAYLREPKRAEELKQTALLHRGVDADESVSEFVVRHFGEEATRMLAGPLLAGVFGGDIHRLSVRAVMTPFVAMEAQSGSLIEAVRAQAAGAFPKPVFGSLKSGLGTFIERMAATIPPSCMRLNSAVASICRRADGWRITTAHGESADYDAVIVATAAEGTRRLLHSAKLAAASEIAELLPVEASSAIVVALGFLPEKAARLRIPRGFGFLVPDPGQRSAENEEHGLLAATFVDQKFSHRAPPGAVLLRGFFGGLAADAMRDWDEDGLVEATRRQLSRLLGPLPDADIFVVRQWPKSLPQYFAGHLARMARLREAQEKLPGVSLIGNSYYGVGLPDMIRDGRSAAKASLSAPASEAAR